MKLLRWGAAKVLAFGGAVRRRIFTLGLTAENGDQLQTEAGDNIFTEGS